MRRHPFLLAVLAAAALAAGCGGSDDDDRPAPGPVVGAKGEEPEAAADLGFPAFATKNTTRVGGADSIANAAAVARAVWPGSDRATRPKAVTLVDKDDWRAGVAAAALIAQPVSSPVLLSDGDELPPASREALEALAPTGSKEAGDAQVIRIGDVAEPKGLKATDVAGTTAPEIAARIDALLSAARGRTSDRVVIAATERPEFATPAAGWAAKSGDPVLFTDRDKLPAPTRVALGRHQQPKIYILGNEQTVSEKVERELRSLGTVERIEGGTSAVENAIAFSRYVDGTFGWGVIDPGHGLVFANADRPMDAVAAAPLSASGTYGPLLLHTGAAQLDRPLESYLLDIQPGFRKDPVRGVYNHGWMIGDEAALPVATQARIDALLEISPVTEQTESSPSS